MKVTVTNTDKVPVERFGQTFLKDKPVTIEVSDREYKALGAVKVLTVEITTEAPAPAKGKTKPASTTPADQTTAGDPPKE